MIHDKDLLTRLFTAATRGMSKVLLKCQLTPAKCEELVVRTLSLFEFMCVCWHVLACLISILILWLRVVLQRSVLHTCTSEANKSVLPSHFTQWCKSHDDVCDYLTDVEKAIRGATFAWAPSPRQCSVLPCSLPWSCATCCSGQRERRGSCGAVRRIIALFFQ